MSHGMKFKELSYQISFSTPAFLGDAGLNAQWRTPPFKALLRHWWRIAAAGGVHYDYKRLRELEGKLFGHAWLEKDQDQNGKAVLARKSLITLRLDSWQPGKLLTPEWSGLMEKVITTEDGKGRVDADVYLGFGAILPASKQEGRPVKTLRGAAIQAGDSNILRLRVPQDHLETILDALELAQSFGSLGSRSRNGWGSIQLKAFTENTPILDANFSTIQQKISRALGKCLQPNNATGCDWPHALGLDDQGHPLIWETPPQKDWRAAMSTLAHIKVGIRSEAKKYIGPGKISGVHLLGYPAGKAWKLNIKNENKQRLASQLRFKVIPTDQGFVSRVFHLPARFPDEIASQLEKDQRSWLQANELQVWQSIHRYLDKHNKLARAGAK